jgi:transcriptional regulator with XRE-family HTH domain
MEVRQEVAREFGRNLFVLRKWAGLTQEETALLAGLHRTEIGCLEHGLRVARIDTVIKLAGSLAVPPASLLKGMEWKVSSAIPGQFVFDRGED